MSSTWGDSGRDSSLGTTAPTSESGTPPSNTSAELADSKYISKLQPSEDYVVGSYLLLLCILSILLNGTVGWISYKRRQRLTPVEWYLVMLSCVNFFHIFAFFMPISAAFSHGWILGDIGCRAYAFLGFITGITNINTMAVMSVMRYLKICHRNFGHRIGPKTVIVSIVGIVVNSLVWTVSPLLGWGQYGPEPTGIACSLAWDNRTTMSKDYITTIFIVSFMLPCFVMIVCYSCITFKLNMAKNKLVISGNLQALVYLSPKARQMTKMAILMCSAFTLTWLPYCITSMWATYGDPAQIPMWLNVIPPLFAKASVCFDPIVYFFFNQRFRNIAMTELGIKWGKVSPHDSSTSIPQSLFPDQDRSRTNVKRIIASATSAVAVTTLRVTPSSKAAVPQQFLDVNAAVGDCSASATQQTQRTKNESCDEEDSGSQGLWGEPR